MSALFFLKDQLTLLALVILILLILAVLALVIRAATRAEPDATTRRIAPRLRSDSLRNSFRQAVDLIEAHIASRSQRYNLPWVLVLEEGNARSPLPLGQSGVASALGVDATESAATPGLKWNFFDKGIVVDIQGSYLQSSEDAGDADKPWDEFLGLCREYRPERPFDALVITVPASLLLDTRADAQLELIELAKRANRRLWLAQNRFAMRFGLYVVVSDCEHVPGFPAYARALPELQSGGMLGWSSPYDLNTNYRQEWVGEALRQTCRTLIDSSAELFASSVDDSSAASYFLLPSRIETMQPQLQVYIDELMRPSSYHEPFILRGLYLTGDASEAAEQLALGQAEDTETTALLDTVRRPVFLRDIFEQKVFAEIGLTRPSNNQLLSRPVLNGVLRWSALGIGVVWLGGLAIGSVALHHQVTKLDEVLAKLQRDAEIQNGAAQRGTALSSTWQRDRTLNLLQLMEELNDMRLWSVFMPGSWPMFDPLSQRLNGLLEQSFLDVAVGTLRQGLYDQTRNLTGASQDPSTGELIASLSCAPAADSTDAAAKTASTLGYEDLPEFTQLLSYLSAAEQLDQGSQALRRLLDPRQPYSGRDLGLVVRVVLGVELPLTKNLDATLFRAENTQKQGLNLLSLQSALRCSLQQKVRTLNAHAFDNNALLVAQRQLNELLRKVDSQDGGNAPGARLQAWQDLSAQLEAMDGLLKHGGGAWLRKSSFQPGQTWDRSLSRIANITALGSDSARALQDESEQAFRRFRTVLDETGDDLPPALRVSWNDKEGRWEMSKGLSDLHSALQALLGQPWMSRNSTRSLGTSSELLISWDLPRLDQALAVADLRKRFQAEQLVRFPAELQGAVEKLVNQQLAQQVSEHLAYALTPGGKAIANDPGRLEAERSRLARIQMLLTDLGDQKLSETLSTLQRQDAAARLRALDQALERAELYAPQGRGFSAWNGSKGPSLAAYALGDSAGLASYLAQQRSRIENLGREAELLLPQGGTDGNASTDRWQAIVRDLERYRLKNPNSNLLALENFLTAMAGDIDAGNCLNRISGAGTGYQASDYFGQRQMQLTFALQQRCRELHAREQAHQWTQFQNLFKRWAAGRPPFAAPGWDNRAPAMEVDELAPLLFSFEQAQRSLRETGNGSRQSPSQTRQFMDQFERVRAFLAPLLPAEEGAASGYDIAVDFRANRQGEQEGNKIIEWGIEIGNQQLDWHDTPRVLRWQPGMPITLHWRLAKDGPAVPRLDLKQPTLSVADRSVALRYTDPWALINLLGRHREAEVGSRSDSRGQLLRFEFPLIVQPEQAGAPTSDSRARVFLRLTISPAGKRTPLAWPGAFPTRAPDASLL